MLQLFDLVFYLLFLKRFDIANTKSSVIVDTFRRTIIKLSLQSSSYFVIFLRIILFWEVLCFHNLFIIIVIFRYYGVCERILFYVFKAANQLILLVQFQIEDSIIIIVKTDELDLTIHGLDIKELFDVCFGIFVISDNEELVELIIHLLKIFSKHS